MARGRIVEDGPTADVRAAFGGRTVSFRPPGRAVRPDGLDEEWLDACPRGPGAARRHEVEVASASLEAAFLALTERRPAPTYATLETTGALR